MTEIFVKPRTVDGQPVHLRQPHRAWSPLPPEGAFVPLDTYWARRLRDGDVVEAEPPTAAPAAPEGDRAASFNVPRGRGRHQEAE